MVKHWSSATLRNQQFQSGNHLLMLILHFELPQNAMSGKSLVNGWMWPLVVVSLWSLKDMAAMALPLTECWTTSPCQPWNFCSFVQRWFAGRDWFFRWLCHGSPRWRRWPGLRFWSAKSGWCGSFGVPRNIRAGDVEFWRSSAKPRFHYILQIFCCSLSAAGIHRQVLADKQQEHAGKWRVELGEMLWAAEVQSNLKKSL